MVDREPFHSHMQNILSLFSDILNASLFQAVYTYLSGNSLWIGLWTIFHLFWGVSISQMDFDTDPYSGRLQSSGRVWVGYLIILFGTIEIYQILPFQTQTRLLTRSINFYRSEIVTLERPIQKLYVSFMFYVTLFSFHDQFLWVFGLLSCRTPSYVQMTTV